MKYNVPAIRINTSKSTYTFTSVKAVDELTATIITNNFYKQKLTYLIFTRIIFVRLPDTRMSAKLKICSETCVKRLLSKRPKFGFQNQLLLNACHKYCRMLQGEHSAILSAFIKLPFVIEIFIFFLVLVAV